MKSSEGTYGGNEERVLVLLRESRDAESVPRVMEGIGVASMRCATPEELCAEIDRGAGALLIEEEVLSPPVLACLHASLESQPSWSEVPVIVLVSRGPETQLARDALLLPGDVTLVERPVRISTLVSRVRSALRSRRRQYMVRDQLLALEQSENRYRTLFDSIDEGFCTLEVIFDEHDKPMDYRFLETNPSFYNQTGMSNILGKTVRELIPELEEHWFETYGRVALTGQPVRFQNRAAPLDRWFDVYAFRSDRPDERHVAIIFSDITERKRAEQEIEKLNADLAARAVELQAANRELESFNYTVAHDLRKPLTVVNGYCQAIMELYGPTLDQECLTFVREAYEGTVRMNRLIDALLLFSQAAHAQPKREWVDLSAVAQEVAMELKQAEPARTVTFRIAPGLAVEGDESLLRVVVANLLGNSWKFTADREEAVIELGAEETDGKPVCFVRDNGIGFDSSEAGDIFTPFQRLTSDQRIGGLGIGLATVQRIITAHGGRIWAEGEPGKGATFFFTVGEAGAHTGEGTT